MQKVYAVSDLHFGRWIRNNPEKDFRMKVQPQKLSERLVEVMKENESKDLFILGDLIDNWNEDPEVQNVLLNFIKNIVDQIPGLKIRYILGQHDMFIRDNFKIDASYVHLMTNIFPDKFIYGHDTYFEINGTTFYMSNFKRGNKPITPEKKVNIFLSHITLGSPKLKLDESNFDLCIAGDIHSCYDNGKLHSCCTPYQLYPSEEKIGYITEITLNGSSSSSRRIKSDSDNFEFLKFDPITRRKVKKGEETQELTLDESDILKMISEEVEKEGLTSIHESMKSSIPTPINFKFTLNKMIIDNIRSVEHLEVDFDAMSGVNYISGKTGAGKSTIFNCIRDAFDDVKELDNKKCKCLDDEGELIVRTAPRIQLWLTYENKEYYIERKHKSLNFKINGESVKMSRRDTQKRLEKELPFTLYWKYYYMQANKHYFASINKTELMRVLFNLKIFDSLFNESEKKIKSCNRKIRNQKDQLLELKGRRKRNEELLTQIDEQISKIQLPEIPEEELSEDKNRMNQLSIKLTEKKKSFESTLDSIRNSDNKINELSKYSLIDSSAIASRLNELSTSLDEIKRLTKEKLIINNEMIKLESQISTLKSIKIENCPHCGKILKGKEESEHIKELESELMKKKEEHNSITVLDDKSILDEIKTLNENSAYKKLYEELKSNYDSLVRQKDEIKSSIDEYEEELESLNKKYSVNNKEDFNDKINQMISMYSDMRSLKVKRKDIENVLASDKQSINLLNEQEKGDKEYLKQLERYNLLFDIHAKGSIPLAVLNRLVKYLNTDKVKFEPVKKKDEFNIDAFINVKGNWISYNDASDGQKCYLDIFILIRITEFLDGIGLLVMDEPISNMDPEYVKSACELIPEINAETILISSHTKLEGYDRMITVEQDERGITNVTF